MYNKWKKKILPLLVIVAMLVGFIPNNITTVHADIVTLNPSVDTHCATVSGTPTMFGTEDLGAGTHNWIGTYTDYDLTNAKTALKFNLSSISGSVDSAILRLYVYEKDGSPSINIFAASSDTWDESPSTTFPSTSGTALYANYSTITQDAWLEFNITSLISSEASGDDIATIIITGDNTNGNLLGICSDEDATYKPQLVINYTPPTPTASISTGVAINETNLDASSVDVTLANETYKNASPSKTNFTLVNAPQGCTIGSVTRINSQKCTVNIAFDGTDFDADITNLKVTVTGAETTSGSSLTTTNAVTIAATNDPESITLSQNGSIIEGQENGKVIKVALSGGTFANTIDPANWTVTPLPPGVTKGAVTRIDSTHVEITLNNNASDYDSNITNTIVSCTAAEYKDSTGDLSANTGIVFTANTTPTVTTDPTIGSITTSSATVNGNITANGGLSITARGIEYKKTSDSSFTVLPEGGTATGVFSVGLTGLEANTSYDVKAYATNSEGTSYGSLVTFSTAAIPNTDPTISDIGNQTTDEDTAVGPISITVGDAETAVGSLTLNATSDNPTLLTVGSYVFGGSDASRTLTITPAPNESGTATVTVTVHDGNGATAQKSFTLTVNAVNDPPTLNPIVDFHINEDAGLQTVNLAGISGGGNETQTLIITATSINTAIIPNPTVNYTSPSATGNLTFTPVADANGPVTIIVTVTDNGTVTNSFQMQFVVTVDAVNDAPTVTGFSKTSTEDNEIIFTQNDFTAHFSDKEGNPMTKVKITTVPSSGALMLGVDPANLVSQNDEIAAASLDTLKYVPTANWNGSASFTWQGFDGNAYSSNSTVSITLDPINDIPTLNNFTISANEDTTLSFSQSNFESNFNDAELDSMVKIKLTGLPANGTLMLGLNPISLNEEVVTSSLGTIKFVPNADWNGSTSFTWQGFDGTVYSTNGTVNITIDPINDAPTVTGFSKTSNEDNEIIFTQNEFTTHFSDKDNNSLTTVKITALPSAGALMLGANPVAQDDEIAAVNLGNLKYVPTANWNGTTSFTWQGFDGTVYSTDSTVSITITGVNDAPTISDIANQTTNEDTATTPISFTIGDLETSASNLVVTAVSGDEAILPQTGIVLSGTGTARTITLTPAPDKNGTVTITVTVKDEGNLEVTDTFTLTVNAVNDAPIISDITNETIDEDTTTSPISFTIGDVETSASNLVVTAVSTDEAILPQSGIVLSGTGTARTITLTPAPDKSGTVTITVKVKDEGNLEVTDTFTLTVNSVNDTPTISDIANVTINEDTATSPISFTIGDVESLTSSLVVTAVSGDEAILPQTGIVLSGTGATRTITLTPAPDKNGTVTITVKVKDEGSLEAIDTFTLTINSVNDTPTISDIANVSINEDTATSPISFTVGDVETSASNLVVTAVSSDEAILPQTGILLTGTGATRTLTLTPAPDKNGTVTITVKVKDEGNLEVTDTFTLTIDAINDTPVVTGFSKTAKENIEIAFTPADFISHYSDVEISAMTKIKITGLPADGTLMLDTTPVSVDAEIDSANLDTLKYVPKADWNGTASFTWQGFDGTIYSTNATVNITITPVNSAPIAQDASIAIDEDTVKTGNLVASDIDLGASLTYSVVTAPTHGTLDLKADGSYTYTPDANYNGADSFTWKANDTLIDSNTATMSITITPINDAPVISNITLNTKQGTAIALQASDFTGKYSDIESSSLVKIQITALPDAQYGTLKLDNDGTMTAITVNQEILAADLGKISFIPSANAGSVAAEFSWKANDGTSYSTVAKTIINIGSFDVVVAEAKTALAIGYAAGDSSSSVTQNVTLDGAGLNATTITWSSDKAGVISNTGLVTRPDYTTGDTKVILTATITKGTATATSTFELTVKALPATANADLESLQVIGIRIAYDKDSNTYSGDVVNEVESVHVTAVAADKNATIKIDGVATNNGNAKLILKIGTNVIPIEITAQDGHTTKTYTLILKRAKTEKTTPETPKNPDNNSIQILVNDQVQEKSATATITKDGDKTIINVSLDPQKLDERLAAEGNNAVVTIPVNMASDVLTVDLNGQMVKNMEDKTAVLEIKTDRASYLIPADQLTIDNVGKQIGASGALSDIHVSIQISEPKDETVQFVEDKSTERGLTIVVKPIEFEISCTYNNQTVGISRFNSYVERMIAVPAGIDPSKITTGVVINADGTVSHVPTKVIMQDGKYYALINSLTNSMYSVIWNPKEFADMANHWAKNDANEAGSRLIVTGIDANTFAPDRDITRAEFAAIIVRALGLKPGNGQNPFSDVKSGTWYYDYVKTAYEYNIIKGYGHKTFKPDSKITREEAMSMLANAMKIAGLNTQISSSDILQQLQSFGDKATIGSWAQSSTANCVKYGIAQGSNGQLNPDRNITRAETAAMVLRLLRKANLI